MQKSETLKELASALCKAQSVMGAAHKDKENPFFKSTYSTLASVVEAVKEPFAENGLSYSQFPISDIEHNRVGITTILMHSSGEFMQSDLLLPLTMKKDAQAAGSAITYARRYALQAIAGIPSDDDDGNGACKGKAAPAAKAIVPTLQDRVQKMLMAYMTEHTITTTEILSFCEVEAEEAITLPMLTKLGQLFKTIKADSSNRIIIEESTISKESK